MPHEVPGSGCEPLSTARYASDRAAHARALPEASGEEHAAHPDLPARRLRLRALQGQPGRRLPARRVAAQVSRSRRAAACLESQQRPADRPRLAGFGRAARRHTRVCAAVLGTLKGPFGAALSGRRAAVRCGHVRRVWPRHACRGECGHASSRSCHVSAVHRPPGGCLTRP